MTLQQNADHIQTTHIGSLPRPPALLDLMKARHEGEAVDPALYDEVLARSVRLCVQKQVDCGIDVVTDGEFSKPGFFSYVFERLEGFEPTPGPRQSGFRREIEAFPEYYAAYFKDAMLGGMVIPFVPVACTGPVRYRGHEAVRRDIENVTAAADAAGVPHDRVFLPATSPAGAGPNKYYKTDEEYFQAVAAALNVEYTAIVAAGLLLQVDDPQMSDLFGDGALDDREKRRRAEIHVEATNAALAGIPAERVRYHTCYGINEGPRIHDAALADVIPYALRIKAGSYSFECANPRHEHEYHVFETVKLPEGKVLCPGCITHASNIVEHPELIAERIRRFADLVGRENVIAAADCGFSSQATYKTEVHPTVVWAKLQALRQGADLATRQLWRR